MSDTAHRRVALSLGAGLLCGLLLSLALRNPLLGIPPGLLLGLLISATGRGR